MRQVVQDVKSGNTAVRELPDPVASTHSVVIANLASLISAGTERYIVELARKSLLGKARQRPDQVRRVLQKLRQEGVLSTLTQVRAKLDEPMPLGYSCAGIVLECGRLVSSLKPGDRVAAAAPHAGVVVAGQNLCARLPDPVSFEQGAYAAVSAIALEGVRLARVELGSRVLVIGLGLIGQLAVALLKAQGCRVFGIDLDPAKLEMARTMGADAVGQGAPLEAVRAFAGGFGVDAALITAATESNGPIELAAEACRAKGRIVLVGVAGLRLPRPPFFQKELEFTVSSSLGPGRGDPSYEEKGIDYPIGYARWTAQRNMKAVLDLVAEGRLPVEKLTTHRFPIERAAEAYELITSGAPGYGIVIEYPPASTLRRRRVELRPRAAVQGQLGVSMIGAGNFARLIMMPLLAGAHDLSLRGLCTARGMNAVYSGNKLGFAFATTELEEVLADTQTRAVFIMTRHDLHAEQVIAALRAGKHTFVEKPLCVRLEELLAIRRCVEELGEGCPLLMAGLNRRFAPATRSLRRFFEGARPLSLSFRFATAELPRSSWPQDPEIGGGRIVGEACHAIDTCVAITASPPVKVYAESVAGESLESTDDRVMITLRHRDGSVSGISYQAGGDRAGPGERIEVFGGGRTAIIDGWDRIDLWRDGKHLRERGGRDKGHAGELEAFLEACRGGAAWPIPWEQLYGSTWASLVAVQSLREGLPVSDEGEQGPCAG